MIDINENILKYKKRKESNVSKSNRKSNHKHEYEECLLIENGRNPHWAIYCKICGKIGNVHLFESDDLKVMSDEEVYRKYNGLKQFEVNTIFQKYI